MGRIRDVNVLVSPLFYANFSPNAYLIFIADINTVYRGGNLCLIYRIKSFNSRLSYILYICLDGKVKIYISTQNVAEFIVCLNGILIGNFIESILKQSSV